MAREGLVVFDETYKGRMQQRASRQVVGPDGQRMVRTFPRRTWSSGKRQQWLLEEEAQAWAAMRWWSVAEWREVESGSVEEGGQMESGLVVYAGRRRGSFTQRVERFPIRTWSAADPEEREQWLPIVEARAWDRMRDWRLKETKVIREPATQVTGLGGVAVAPPASPAMPLEVVLDDARRITQTVKRTLEHEAEKEKLQFCISDGGVVHKRGCVNWPKNPLEVFSTFAEAINSELAQRAHSLCCRETMALTAALDRVEAEASVAQMNALGESYGQGADEA